MNEIIANIGYVFLTINLILLLKGFSSNGKAFKIFTIYTIIIFIIQLISNILFRCRMNNLFLSHAYFVLQFVILSFFYLEILKTKMQKKTVFLFLFLCPLLLAIQYANEPSLFFKFNLFEIFITSFLLVIYAVFHLYNMLNEKKVFYYINLGILIYLFGSTILFLVGNLMIHFSSELNKYTWILNSLLYVIYQLFILFECNRILRKQWT